MQKMASHGNESLKHPCPELLAPAGMPDAAWAALEHGANAVYAGLPRFSARAEAGNFGADELGQMIGYAHHLGRRVYITFNTLAQQRELGDALEMLAQIRDLAADGVIVQDMGVARMVRARFPQLRLHASTQMAVHNLAGAQQLADAGFKRVVLARELGLDAIEHISRCCGIETETFIHGALCYSYSGLCLFSSHLLGRSGNRGRCAYCCRQPFESAGEESLPFSMKDFCAADYLQKLLDAGVSSFKIEGRMKSPLYVAAVTDLYRRMLDGDAENLPQRLADIQTIFGRPSTELYLSGDQTRPVDPVNDGHRGAQIGTVKAVRGGWLILDSNRALEKHDGLKVEMPGRTSAYGFAAAELRLASDPEQKRRFELPADCEVALRLPGDAPRLEKGSPVYCSYSQAVRQRYRFSAPRPGQFRPRRPVNIRVFQTLETVQLTALADGAQSRLVLAGPFEAARQPEKAEDAIRNCFEKLGETDWKLNELEILGDPVFVSMSVLNDARRRLIDDLSNGWKKPELDFQSLEKFTNAPASKEICWSVKSRGFQALENIDEFVLVVDPDRPREIENAAAFYGDKLRLALPVIIRDEDAETFRALIRQASNGSAGSLQGIRKWEAANVGGLNLLKGIADVSADWSLYTLNEQAALEWVAQSVGLFVLSPEDDAENIKALIGRLGGAAVVPIYQHTPLMISATRPEAAGDELQDRSHRGFRVEQNGREFVLFSETPFSLVSHLDTLKAAGARRFRIDLSYGDVSAEIVSKILAGEPVPGSDGNYSRGLL